jgi:glycosyltransferase involved in cell wall biosynthesis
LERQADPMDSAERPHLLFAAFAEVPGPSATSARFSQLIPSFGEDLEVDAMTLKGRDLAHIQRLGFARMMRVPTHDQPYLQRLGTYTRALTRQLSSDPYQLVYAGDVFSAQVAAKQKKAHDFTLILEVSDLPSVSLTARHPVDGSAADLGALQTQWYEMERAALKGADIVVAPSRQAAKRLSDRVDARKIHLLPRAVDRAVFTPSPARVAGASRPPSVMVLGARETGGERHRALGVLRRLSLLLPPEVEIVLAAQGQHSEELARALEGTGLDGRVRHLDVDSPLRLAKRLNEADIVVVPARRGAVASLGIPHRALEAMACGCAVVLDGDPALCKGIVEVGEGILVPEDNEAIAEAIVELLGDEQRRAAIANTGYAAVDRMDLGDRLEAFAAWMSDLLQVTIEPRMPETTLAALKEMLEPSVVADAPVAAVDPAETTDPAQQAEDGEAEAVPDDGGERVDLGRFSSDRILSAEGAALSDESDMWGGQTEVEADEAPAPAADPADKASPTGARELPGLYSTETDLRPLVTDIRELKPQTLSSGAFQAVNTMEQQQEASTRQAASEVAAAAEKERAVVYEEMDVDDDETRSLPKLGSPIVSRDDSQHRPPSALGEHGGLAPAGQASSARPPTSLSLAADLDTESALDDSALAARATDPSMMTSSALSESTIRSLVADVDKASDDWAPDTIFDARPVFQSQERALSRDLGSLERSDADDSDDERTRRNPPSPTATDTATRGPSKGSLLVDADGNAASESGEGSSGG